MNEQSEEQQRFERLGWRAVGATGVSWTVDSNERLWDFDSRSWLAIADEKDGEVAISIWEGEGEESAQRRLGIWMPRESAQRLMEALAAVLDASVGGVR